MLFTWLLAELNIKIIKVIFFKLKKKYKITIYNEKGRICQNLSSFPTSNYYYISKSFLLWISESVNSIACLIKINLITEFFHTIKPFFKYTNRTQRKTSVWFTESSLSRVLHNKGISALQWPLWDFFVPFICKP